jgi:tripartite-type tricarboxylate transporter receptor subunit TctC
MSQTPILGRRALAALPLALGAAGVSAQTGQPLRLVVGTLPGSATDILARLISPAMGASLNQPVVVDNRSGASGVVAAEQLTRLPPDGQVVMLGTIASHAIGPLLMRPRPYDAVADFSHISLVATQANLLMVHPGVAATSLGELVALAKRTPGGLDYGSVGNGSSSHLAMEMLRARSGAPFNHIPYRDAAQALTALVAGQVPVLVYGVAGALPHLQTDRARALAVLSAQRHEELPRIPTAIEAGFVDFIVEVWMGLFGPAGLPEPVVGRLHAAVRAALADPALAPRLKAQGIAARGLPPGETRAFVQRETARWEEVIRASGAAQG